MRPGLPTGHPWITAIVAEGWHGEELANRISDLGGDPLVHPAEWEKSANAPFTPPRKSRADAGGMVADQLKAEAGAIQAYTRLARLTFGKDPVAYALATELLKDEVRHEEFLENLLADRKPG